MSDENQSNGSVSGGDPARLLRPKTDTGEQVWQQAGGFELVRGCYVCEKPAAPSGANGETVEGAVYSAALGRYRHDACLPSDEAFEAASAAVAEQQEFDDALEGREPVNALEFDVPAGWVLWARGDGGEKREADARAQRAHDLHGYDVYRFRGHTTKCNRFDCDVDVLEGDHVVTANGDRAVYHVECIAFLQGRSLDPELDQEPSRRRINTLWASYHDRAINKSALAPHVEECRRAFFGGAAATFDALLKATEGDDNEAERCFDQVAAELQAFKPINAGAVPEFSLFCRLLAFANKVSCHCVDGRRVGLLKPDESCVRCMAAAFIREHARGLLPESEREDAPRGPVEPPRAENVAPGFLVPPPKVSADAAMAALRNSGATFEGTAQGVWSQPRCDQYQIGFAGTDKSDIRLLVLALMRRSSIEAIHLLSPEDAHAMAEKLHTMARALEVARG